MSTSLPQFSLEEIPFSMRGSWLNLSPIIGLNERSDHVHLVSHTGGIHPIFAFVPTRDGVELSAPVTANPAALSWDCGSSARMRATFASPSRLLLAGEGVDLTLSEASSALTPFTGSYLFLDPMDSAAVLTSYETGRRYRVTVQRGEMEIVGAEALGDAERAVVVTGSDGWEIAIEEFDTSAVSASEPVLAFDDAVANSASMFAEYVDKIANWRRPETAGTVELAAYVMWSATVAPAGFLSRESVLMSKHWMDKVWSWDHCFNAIALAGGLPDAAIDQFLAPFDHQEPGGAMPDSITHSEVLYNFVKPPIHGWALRRLRAAASAPVSRDQLVEVYEHLADWTRFWLEQRTAPGRQIPHYQHGNDSGWDNSTMFDIDRVVEAPDLAAFLAVQMDVLADLADELDIAAGDSWRQRSERMQRALLDELRDAEGFFARGVLSGQKSTRTSLLPLLAVVIADRLPTELGDQLASQIEEHLTEWGPATQRPDTVEYEADGYWRGPIWAPSTVLIEDGLRRGGYTELADAVSSRFRALCERSGFAENFDALSGEGLRDRAYTWTASAYLMLARDSAHRVS
ncbi:glycogen debranching enzyme [Microbacterium halimionae]|uniref:Glycogen debranching enzyme n=1 Tax=Microbacterium halimionae TaxID=1526413 RepID=A0A7W3PKY6_9MICO|nr:glycogen debranching protein [Microbacterium halimionae]MBA8815324.1 glycogen debranching enzyme [Microbacterium halimionae]NII93885.1 glycogen debranching enzyme [Microbacterium halimionae]